MERRYGSLHRQTGRQGNDSFFALTHAWLNLHFFSLSLSLSLFSLAGWSMMLHNFSSIAQRERERTLCPISSVVLTSNERRKGAISTFWLIFIFCRFTSSSSSFLLISTPLHSTFVVSNAGRIDCSDRDVTPRHNNSISPDCCYLVSQSLSSARVYQQRLSTRSGVSIKIDRVHNRQQVVNIQDTHTRERGRAWAF